MQNILVYIKERSRLLQALLFIMALGAFASCEEEYKPFNPVEQRETDEKRLQEYFQKNNIDVSTLTHTNSGLYYQLLEPGNGQQVESGDKVEVHYTGTLLNGTKFDSSHDRNKTFVVNPVGAGKVIAGWDEGLKLMKVGEKSRLYIPSHLGYGPYNQGSIPANSVLIFDVEVISIQ